MIITNKSILSGKTTSMNIDVTEAQMQEYYKGELAQLAFPNINAGEREFIRSGISPDEWVKSFGIENDE
jgi:hypothetical protein